MDELTNKQTRTYDYISRYASFPFYYNEKDRKYIYGLTSQLSRDVSYVEHEIRSGDTLDSISDKYYGRPDLYWVIADFNGLLDPFERLWGNMKTIRVPTLSNVTFEGF